MNNSLQLSDEVLRKAKLIQTKADFWLMIHFLESTPVPSRGEE